MQIKIAAALSIISLQSAILFFVACSDNNQALAVENVPTVSIATQDTSIGISDSVTVRLQSNRSSGMQLKYSWQIGATGHPVIISDSSFRIAFQESGRYVIIVNSIDEHGRKSLPDSISISVFARQHFMNNNSLDSLLQIFIPYKKIYKMNFEHVENHSSTQSFTPWEGFFSDVYWEFIKDSLHNSLRIIESRKMILHVLSGYPPGSPNDTINLSETSHTTYDTIDIYEKDTVLKIEIRGDNDSIFSDNIYWSYLLHSICNIDTAYGYATFTPDMETTAFFNGIKYVARKTMLLTTYAPYFEIGSIIIKNEIGPLTITKEHPYCITSTHVKALDVFTLKEVFYKP